jgi:cytochrome c-type protein NapC
MISPGTILVALAVCTVVLIAALALWPAVTRDRGGKTLAFVGLFILPGFIGVFGAWDHVEHSKSTSFCLSCHVMEPFAQSLDLDEPTYLAASHFQNSRVPREQACYSCHTDYTMYGDIASKWRGLRHVYAYYVGGAPEPEEIRLYVPYNNRECLHCHEGARSFEEFPLHTLPPEMRAALGSNETSCLLCHDVAHGVKTQEAAGGIR